MSVMTLVADRDLALQAKKEAEAVASKLRVQLSAKEAEVECLKRLHAEELDESLKEREQESMKVVTDRALMLAGAQRSLEMQVDRLSKEKQSMERELGVLTQRLVAAQVLLVFVLSLDARWRFFEYCTVVHAWALSSHKLVRSGGRDCVASGS